MTIPYGSRELAIEMAPSFAPQPVPGPGVDLFDKDYSDAAIDQTIARILVRSERAWITSRCLVRANIYFLGSDRGQSMWLAETKPRLVRAISEVPGVTSEQQERALIALDAFPPRFLTITLVGSQGSLRLVPGPRGPRVVSL